LNTRLYLDYNSTSPLAESVIDLFSSGDLSFANPASVHTSGKTAKKLVRDTTTYLKNLFKLKDHDVLYHSGATEALNTFFNISSEDLFVFSSADHPAASFLAKNHKSRGGEVVELNVSAHGEFDYESLKEIINNSHKSIYLNFTWVNNETGIVNDLKKIASFKSEKLFIHVDAVQSPGKIKNWEKLNESIDFISFSGHKFGALKGIGFSFVTKDFPLKPIIHGGGQQSSMRAGTENTIGAYTLQLAFRELIEKVNIDHNAILRSKIIDLFKSKIKENGIVITSNLEIASNTIGFIFKNIKSDLCLIQFDIGGIDVSYGSACSSGNQTETQSLKALGLSEFEDKFIRLSFGFEDYKNEDVILEKLSEVFFRLAKI